MLILIIDVPHSPLWTCLMLIPCGLCSLHAGRCTVGDLVFLSRQYIPQIKLSWFTYDVSVGSVHLSWDMAHWFTLLLSEYNANASYQWYPGMYYNDMILFHGCILYPTTSTTNLPLVWLNPPRRSWKRCWRMKNSWRCQRVIPGPCNPQTDLLQFPLSTI